MKKSNVDPAYYSAKNEFKYNEIPNYILELPILKNSIPKI
jgi:hypothetical protein